jgi:DHA2 family multidrug resistance protein
MSDLTTAGAQERADIGAWLAVAAGTIGALMATLDISIVNTSLPTIQGAISASGSEGTWVSTAYLVAEIIMIPLVGWFTSILGLRRFLLVMTSLFVVFSMWCGLAESLVVMIIGRVGQGFTGGAMIPTALTIVATRLPPRQQAVGLALFGMTAVLGPVLGPVVGGWLTENLSWHYVFFLNLPIGIGLLTLILLGLTQSRLDLSRLRDTDVFGLLGLILGLGALTVVLEEGQRERWFESDMISSLSVVCVIGFLMIMAGQLYAHQPIIRLKILLTRSFGSAFTLSLTTGAALYGVLYLVPQFLTEVPGYNLGKLCTGVIK